MGFRVEVSQLENTSAYLHIVHIRASPIGYYSWQLLDFDLDGTSKKCRQAKSTEAGLGWIKNTTRLVDMVNIVNR